MKISDDKLIQHVGCGAVDDVGCCVFCDLIRARLKRDAVSRASNSDLRAALEVPVNYWRSYFASHGSQRWTVNDEFWHQWLDAYAHLVPESPRSVVAVDPHDGTQGKPSTRESVTALSSND